MHYCLRRIYWKSIRPFAWAPDGDLHHKRKRIGVRYQRVLALGGCEGPQDAVTTFSVFHASCVSQFKLKKKSNILSALVAPRPSVRTRMLLSRVRDLNSCVVSGIAFWRVIFLNIRKPNGVSCPGFAPRLFCQPSGLSYSVQKWNARRVNSTSVLLPNSSLFTQAQFKRLCNSNVNGQWFKCQQISIYFYNSGFWQSASVPY